jgi:3-hydroxyacyl-CoA dehydrogenase/enoyl-CoA hydratase/3-hydroxybutyryl-CoA epimerase
MKTFTTALNDQGVLTITIDVPGEAMNVFNQQVIDDFDTLSNEIESDEEIKAVVFISGKAEGFIAGADIKMLQRVETAMDGASISLAAHTLLNRIRNSNKPHIAAIDGACLGVGYELALACHYRIATDDKHTKLGLPEVMLGLLPGGMGNTQLPRLINLPAALDLLLSGKQIDSKRALQLRMIDEVVPQKILLGTAQTKAVQCMTQGVPQRSSPWQDRVLRLPLIKDIIIKKARQQVLRKTHGLYPAPLAILDVIQQGLLKSLPDALAIEAEKFGELTVSPEAKQLINIYFATTALKKERYVGATIKPHEVNYLGILGGGLMGAGIATVSIDKADVSVRLKDIRDEGILSVYQHSSQFYTQRVSRRILSQEQARKKLNQLTSALDYSGFKRCDLVIEAVFEDLQIKQTMVADIEALGNEDTVFASNTSSIPITEIAAKAKRPENIIGMHYFSPVEKMPLLEIVKHPGTAKKTLATAVQFGRKQGKTVIVVNDGAGFYVNRILVPYLNTALALGMEGVAFDKIDKALVNFGFPVGPFKLLDEVGLDIGNKIQPVLEKAFGQRMASPGVENILLGNQRLGKKVSKGFYRYDDPKKTREIDTTVYQELGITPNKVVSEKDIVERCIYPLLNEAVLCLDYEIINTVRDGDIGAIFGIGFPPFLGGPFRYMDSLGINYVVDKLTELSKAHGMKYEPAPLLISMSINHQSFY